MPSYRIDWDAVKVKCEGAGFELDESCLLVLPAAGAYLLAALAEPLHWQATYRTEDYDFADWDLLQQIVDRTFEGLDPNG